MSVEEIRIELDYLKRELGDVKDTLREVRDKVLSTQTCPQPGLCLLLQSQAVDRETRLRALERRDAYIIGACAIGSIVISIGMPVILKYVLKLN